MNSKLVLLVFALVFSSYLIRGQEDSVFRPTKKIGFGIANIGTVIVKSIDSSQAFPGVIQYVFDYRHEIDTGLYTRYGIATTISSTKTNGLRNYYFSPMNFNIGIEKEFIKQKWLLYYGVDLFYTMILNGQFGSGIWQSYNNGFGISPLGSIAYELNEKWSIGSEISIGFGLISKYVPAGNTTKVALEPNIYYLRALSFRIIRKLD